MSHECLLRSVPQFFKLFAQLSDAWLNVRTGWEDEFTSRVDRWLLHRCPRHLKALHRARLGERRRTIERKIERAVVQHDAGAISDGVLRRRVAALRQEFEGLAAVKPLVPVQQTGVVESLADRWEQMAPSQRRGLLATIFDEMTILDGTVASAKPKADWVRYFEEVTTLPEVRAPNEGVAGRGPATGAPRLVMRGGRLVQCAAVGHD